MDRHPGVTIFMQALAPLREASVVNLMRMSVVEAATGRLSTSL